MASNIQTVFAFFALCAGAVGAFSVLGEFFLTGQLTLQSRPNSEKCSPTTMLIIVFIMIWLFYSGVKLL